MNVGSEESVRASDRTSELRAAVDVCASPMHNNPIPYTHTIYKSLLLSHYVYKNIFFLYLAEKKNIAFFHLFHVHWALRSLLMPY